MRDGESVLLRPMAERDLGTMAGWDADQELANLMGGVVRSEAESRARFSKLLSDRNSVAMSILTQDGRLIGDIELTEIAWRSGDAELMVRIGDPAYRGGGIGAYAVRSMLSMAFEQFGLARVYLRACADNHRAIRCYHRCGFRCEGVVRRNLGPNGEARQVVLMTILKLDFIRVKAAS